jgi:hypothetical protein
MTKKLLWLRFLLLALSCPAAHGQGRTFAGRTQAISGRMVSG